jgi:hypothetical protein
LQGLCAEQTVKNAVCEKRADAVMKCLRHEHSSEPADPPNFLVQLKSGTWKKQNERAKYIYKSIKYKCERHGCDIPDALCTCTILVTMENWTERTPQYAWILLS